MCYGTVLAERGATLSGGQCQRLAIARAVCRDLPIVILDEPTAALDAASEAKLLDLITATATGRTIVVATHRPSSVRRADRILVVDRRRIAEEGDHETLVALSGVCANRHRLHAGTSEPVGPGEPLVRGDGGD